MKYARATDQDLALQRDALKAADCARIAADDGTFAAEAF
jgi:hypothetical protein